MTRELKQSDVAQATGLTRAMVSAFETGKVYPSLESLFAYLGGVGCNLGDLQQELDKAAGRREGTTAPLPPSAEEVYRRIGKAVVQTVDEVCRELGLMEAECLSELPPSAGTSGEGGNRKGE
jgi:transcriptional regulator with XRE-family HTH domain